VPAKLQSLSDQGYILTVFTNQGGLASGRAKASDLEIKFADIQSKVGRPMVFLGAA